MNHIDLFSGIGGFALAARWAGFETVQMVEIDTYCQRVLSKNFPGVPIHGDIKTFTPAYDFHGRGIGRIDLLTGGFPCQPFSVAGKRMGAKDDRALWPEMFRVISEVWPDWIVAENVAGILNTVEFDGVLSDLEKAGYAVGTFVLPACAVNAPHRRDRVWIVANRTGAKQQRNQSGVLRYERRGETLRCTDGTPGSILAGAVRKDRTSSDADSAGRGKQRGSLTIPEEFFTLERADWRSIEPLLCRGDDGIPGKLDAGRRNRSARLKGLGNAIVPQVVYPILKIISEFQSCQS